MLYSYKNNRDGLRNTDKPYTVSLLTIIFMFHQLKCLYLDVIQLQRSSYAFVLRDFLECHKIYDSLSLACLLSVRGHPLALPHFGGKKKIKYYSSPLYRNQSINIFPNMHAFEIKALRGCCWVKCFHDDHKGVFFFFSMDAADAHMLY